MNRQPSTSLSNLGGQFLRRSTDITGNRPPVMRGYGIMRNRGLPRPLEDRNLTETNPKTDELIAKFFVAHGLPFESIHDRTFRDLVQHLNPSTVIPMPKVLETNIERMGAPGKPMVNYSKSVGPLSVTVDITGTKDEKFLCFSVHYFEDLNERKNVVYLRKMMLSIPDNESLMTTIRRAVNNYSYANVRLTNFVCPDQKIHDMLCSNDVIKRKFMCFHFYMTKFVEAVFQIKEFTQGYNSLVLFVRHVKSNVDLYSRFRREQLTKNGDLDMPSIGKGKWDQTVAFLTRCLVMHDSFSLFSSRANLTLYITNEKYFELTFFQRVLQQCVKHSRDLSQANSSISQVVPAIMSMRNFLTSQTLSFPFEKQIRDAFTKNFQQYTSETQSPRYDTAAFLDPRFGYRDNVYTSGIWTSIEKKLVEDFSTTAANNERSFKMDINIIPYEDRKEMITSELKRYRQAINTDRPEENQNPFLWWGRRQAEMEILATLAREFLACPAVAIDSQHFFGDGGKLRHLCHVYDYQVLEHSLTVSGANQQFCGRGAAVDKIPPHILEQLNHTTFRRQKDSYLNKRALDQFTMNAGSDYPPLPVPDQTPAKRPRTGEEFPKLEPDVEDSVISNVIPKVEQNVSSNDNPILFPKATPNVLEEQKPDVGDNSLHYVEEQLKLEEIDDGYEQAMTSFTTSSETLDGEVKMEQLNTVSAMPKTAQAVPIKACVIRPQGPSMPASSKPIIVKPFINPVRRVPPNSRKTLQMLRESHKPLVGKPLPPIVSKTISKTVLKTTAPNATCSMPPTYRPTVPQFIQQHNFVQKFAQGQNFVRKFPEKISTNPSTSQIVRLPPGNAVIAPISTGNSFLLNEPKLENQPFLTEFKEEPLDFDDNDFNNESYSRILDDSSVNRIQMQLEYEKNSRRQCNRNCSCCGRLVPHTLLKNVTIESEKMLVILGAVYRKYMSVVKAQTLLKRPVKTYMCRAHFPEAVSEIFKMLRVNRPMDIASAKLDFINNAQLSVHSIYNRNVSSQLLRQQFINFTEKYYEEATEAVANNRLTFDRPPSPDELNDFDEQEILPKCVRQPRKQVLEIEQFDPTVKVIEQEEFKLPQAAPIENSEECQNPEKCCFCLLRADRSIMLRVPKSEDRLARWVHKIGPEFATRIKKDEDNYICRSHFPVNAFSSRGRLLKGQLPTAEIKKVETSYALDRNTGQFEKLDIQKSGTLKDSTINLASNSSNNKKKSLQWHEDEDYDEECYEPNSTDSEVTEDDEPGPSNKGSRYITRSKSRSLTPAIDNEKPMMDEETAEEYFPPITTSVVSNEPAVQLSNDLVEPKEEPSIRTSSRIRTKLIPK